MLPEPASSAVAQASADRPLGTSAALAGAATLTSRILGLARESVLAAVFGASNDMDAFFVAFRIPNLTRDLFAEGAMSAAFVPTFSRYLTVKGKADAWRLGNNVINALIAASGLVVVLGIIFAPSLVRGFAGVYGNVPGKLELTVTLARLLLPFLTLVAVAAAMMGMLNSLQHYFVPSLAPAMFNVAAIFAALVLVPLMPALGWPRIMAMPIGALLGGLGQIAIQWRPLRREGFRYTPVLDRHDEGLRQILALMGPGTLGLAATQVNVLINTLLATAQGTGAVSWLTYAFRLMYLPIGLFGVSVATAVLPNVARQAALGDHTAVRATVSRGLALMLAVNVPAMCGLIVLAHPIAQVLFERGRFLSADTLATAAALRFYAIGLVGYSAVRIISPVFYTLGRSRVPVAVSCGAVLVNLIGSVLLVRVLGFRGLALSTSIAALMNGATLIWMLRGALRGIDGRHLGHTLSKVAVASGVMSAIVLLTERWTATVLGTAHLMTQAICLSAAIAAGLAALAATARLLRVREFDELFTLVRDRLRSRC